VRQARSGVARKERRAHDIWRLGPAHRPPRHTRTQHVATWDEWRTCSPPGSHACWVYDGSAAAPSKSTSSRLPTSPGDGGMYPRLLSRHTATGKERSGGTVHNSHARDMAPPPAAAGPMAELQVHTPAPSTHARPLHMSPGRKGAERNCVQQVREVCAGKMASRRMLQRARYMTMWRVVLRGIAGYQPHSMEIRANWSRCRSVPQDDSRRRRGNMRAIPRRTTRHVTNDSVLRRGTVLCRSRWTRLDPWTGHAVLQAQSDQNHQAAAQVPSGRPRLWQGARLHNPHLRTRKRTPVFALLRAEAHHPRRLPSSPTPGGHTDGPCGACGCR
jgi:hypothetical protein